MDEIERPSDDNRDLWEPREWGPAPQLMADGLVSVSDEVRAKREIEDIRARLSEAISA
jgi:hypothetical protein